MIHPPPSSPPADLPAAIAHLEAAVAILRQHAMGKPRETADRHNAYASTTLTLAMQIQKEIGRFGLPEGDGGLVRAPSNNAAKYRKVPADENIEWEMPERRCRNCGAPNEMLKSGGTEPKPIQRKPGDRIFRRFSCTRCQSSFRNEVVEIPRECLPEFREVVNRIRP